VQLALQRWEGDVDDVEVEAVHERGGEDERQRQSLTVAIHRLMIIDIVDINQRLIDVD
jgi:hypothetical protein